MHLHLFYEKAATPVRIKHGMDVQRLASDHEQEKAYVKGSGGCVGLTENPTSCRRWMVSSGPEMARLQREFVDMYLLDADSDHPRSFRNHEQGFSTQKRLQKQVNSLIETIEKMDNPFSDDCPELVKLDSRNCVDESIAKDLFILEETGIKQYQALNLPHDFA